MVNFLGAHRMLEACRVLGISPRVLLVGSATVYGAVGREEPPISETHPVRPTDAYSLAKAAAEMLAPVYESHFPVMVARSFNHTGPGQGTDFALPAFASQIARIEAGLQEPVIRVGDLGAERDFLDVRDVVAAYALLLERGKATTTYNVCSGACRPVSAWLDQLVGLAKIPVHLERDPSRVFVQSNPGWLATIPVSNRWGGRLAFRRRRCFRPCSRTGVCASASLHDLQGPEPGPPPPLDARARPRPRDAPGGGGRLERAPRRRGPVAFRTAHLGCVGLEGVGNPSRRIRPGVRFPLGPGPLPATQAPRGADPTPVDRGDLSGARLAFHPRSTTGHPAPARKTGHLRTGLPPSVASARGSGGAGLVLRAHRRRGHGTDGRVRPGDRSGKRSRDARNREGAKRAVAIRRGERRRIARGPVDGVRHAAAAAEDRGRFGMLRLGHLGGRRLPFAEGPAPGACPDARPRRGVPRLERRPSRAGEGPRTARDRPGPFRLRRPDRTESAREIGVRHRQHRGSGAAVVDHRSRPGRSRGEASRPGKPTGREAAEPGSPPGGSRTPFEGDRSHPGHREQPPSKVWECSSTDSTIPSIRT
jgi:hypothetical protein